MAARSNLRRHVGEIVTCPICLVDLQDPRSLPCLHSFCFECLQAHYEDKYPGDDVSCPVCRKDFQIPQGGLGNLPPNFFLQDLIEAKDLKSKKPETACDEHPDRRLEMYCFDCSVNICVKCFTASHQQHKCAEVEEISKVFAAQILADIEPLSSHISQFREEITKVETANKKFLETVDTMEHDVQERGTEIKRLVDDHVAKLIQELNAIRERSVKEAETRVESFELALAGLESFQAYSSEIASKGSPCDITRSFNDLRTKAEELLKSKITIDDYSPPDIQFLPVFDVLSEVLIKEGINNMIGCFTQSDGRFRILQLKFTIAYVYISMSNNSSNVTRPFFVPCCHLCVRVFSLVLHMHV